MNHTITTVSLYYFIISDKIHTSFDCQQWNEPKIRLNRLTPYTKTRQECLWPTTDRLSSRIAECWGVRPRVVIGPQIGRVLRRYLGPRSAAPAEDVRLRRQPLRGAVRRQPVRGELPSVPRVRFSCVTRHVCVVRFQDPAVQQVANNADIAQRGLDNYNPFANQDKAVRSIDWCPFRPYSVHVHAFLELSVWNCLEHLHAFVSW